MIISEGMKNNFDDIMIRPSKESEREIIRNLVNPVFKKYSGHMWAREKDRLSDEGFQTYHEKGELFVAEKEGSIIGCITMSPEGEDAVKVGMLVVREDLQKQGIGRRLMDYTTQLALSNKSCKRMLLTTLYLTHKPDDWNKVQMPTFYRKFGFELVDTRDLLETEPAIVEFIADDITLCIHEKRINQL